MTTLDNQRVAILEDNPDNRDRWVDLVKMCGGIGVPVVPPVPSLSELETYFENYNIAMVMCDNRLFEHDYADYYGAAAVAASYRSGRGGVLITAYEKDDAELSIRQFRRWVPAL